MIVLIAQRSPPATYITYKLYMPKYSIFSILFTGSKEEDSTQAATILHSDSSCGPHKRQQNIYRPPHSGSKRTQALAVTHQLDACKMAVACISILNFFSKLCVQLLASNIFLYLKENKGNMIKLYVWLAPVFIQWDIKSHSFSE